MKNKEIIAINKMQEYINKVFKYTNGYTYEMFIKDDKTIDATVFAISQIGELVKNIEEETKNQHKEIAWNVIKNLRNKIVHDYEGINIVIIWDIIQNDLPDLMENLKKI